MGFSGNGSSELAKLQAQFKELAQQKEQRNARVATAITDSLKKRLLAGPWPPRKDGTPSTIPDLAQFVSVTAEGNAFRIKIDDQAAAFLSSGTSKMAARELLDESELTAAVETAFEAAVAEVLGR